MKSIIIILIFFFTSSFCLFGQKEKSEYDLFIKSLPKWEKKIFDEDTCKDSIKATIKDWESNDFVYYVIGDLGNWDITKYRFMYEKYDIKWEGVGCEGDYCEWEENKYIEYKLKQKNGEDFFKQLEISTDSLYAINQGDRDASYKAGRLEQFKYVYCNLNIPERLNDLKQDTTKVITFHLRFTVDTFGKAVHPYIKFLRNSTEKAFFESEAQRIVADMGEWIPAQYSRIKKPTEEYMTITYSTEEVFRNCYRSQDQSISSKRKKRTFNFRRKSKE